MSAETIAIIGVLSNICVGLSTLGLTILGFFTLQQWRRELKGKAKFELARTLALLLFKYRDQFHTVRVSLTYSGEAQDRQKREDEAPDVMLLNDEFFARKKRLDLLIEITRQLREVAWETEILLSPNVAKQIDALLQNSYTLRTAFQEYFKRQLAHLQHPSADRFQNEKSIEIEDKLNDTVYGFEDDELGKSVTIEVDRIISSLKQYVG